jgi:phosphohistidine phosphatase
VHTLHLLRHAKSSWDEGIEDAKRPLAKRGRQAARLIGETLPNAIGPLDLVLCSTAIRARETAELTLAGYKKAPRVLYEDALYLATPAVLIGRLRTIDEGCGTVMVVGHNPGLHELALALAAPASTQAQALAEGKFPTGVRIGLAIEGSWTEIDRARHEIIAYVTVKSLGGKE